MERTLRQLKLEHMRSGDLERLMICGVNGSTVVDCCNLSS